jgi:hypothetical protein
MNGFDLGKLIARLFGFLLAHDGVSNSLNIWFGSPATVGDVDLLGTKLAPLFSVVAGILLWVFAPLLAPAEHAESVPDSQDKVAATLIAAVGAYLFLAYAYSFVSLFLARGSAEPGPQKVSDLSLWFELAVCVGFAICVSNARRVATWVAR